MCCCPAIRPARLCIAHDSGMSVTCAALPHVCTVLSIMRSASSTANTCSRHALIERVKVSAAAVLQVLPPEEAARVAAPQLRVCQKPAEGVPAACSVHSGLSDSM